MAVSGLGVIVILLWGAEANLLNNQAIASSMYGFVSYGGDEAAPLEDAAIVIRSLGAGWHQAEGPLTMSKGITWGMIQPDSLDEYDWSSVSWVEASAAAGLELLLDVTPGHDNSWIDNYSRWVDCDAASQVWPTCNCPPTNYQYWYNFAYAVAEHFDGTHGAPLVEHFMTVGENDDLHYWLGTVQQYYGSEETVVITRKNQMGEKTLPAALVPVFWQGIHDANPRAQVVVGACTAWRSYGWTNLKELIDGGATPEAVVAQAQRYGLTNSYTSILDSLEYDAEIMRSVEFFYPSLAYSAYYDCYAAHFYAPHGYNDAMTFLLDRMAVLGVEKPVWMTGEGRPFLASEASHCQNAYLHLRNIIYSHYLGLVWHDVSFLVDVMFLNCCGLYSQPDSGLDYPVRHPVADTFRLLAHLLPTASSSSPIEVVSPFDNTELYAFEILHEPTGYQGFVAAGWCSNQCPQYSSLEWWCTDGCPKPEISLHEELGIGPGTAAVVLDYAGLILCRTCEGLAPVVFAEAPFVVVWGPDQDHDCVPDIVDNCPEIPNPEQLNRSSEAIGGVGNPAIPAPDWLGDACDPCPDNGDPDCQGECSPTGVTLLMPSTTFFPGVPCYLLAQVCNHEVTPLPDIPLFVLLDVYGEYWFAPAWSQGITYYVLTLPVGPTLITVIPQFLWPAGVGSASGIYFHAALTDQAITTLIGVMSSYQFGWQE